MYFVLNLEEGMTNLMLVDQRFLKCRIEIGEFDTQTHFPPPPPHTKYKELVIFPQYFGSTNIHVYE